MGLLRALRLAFASDKAPSPGRLSLVSPTPSARFSVDVPPEMLEAMTAGGAIAPRISRNEALQVPAVLRSRNLICGPLATLPIRVHKPDRRVVEGVTYLVPDPDPEIAASVLMAQTFEDLLFEGISWWRVTERGWHGYPTEARHVPVEAVHVAQTGSLLPSQTTISPDQPFPATGQVYIDGVPVPDRDVIRFDSPNPPLLRHAARAIRTCLRLDRTASDYSDEPLPLGFFTPKEGVDPEGSDEDAIQEMLDEWETQRRTRAWGYVGAALDVHPMQWNPEQLQLADQRQHAVLEIARAAGIDPEDLGVSTTSRTYQNSEQRRQDLLDFTLGPYVSAVQERLSMRDILPRGYQARVDFAGFLRSDTKTRMETYAIGLKVGAYTEDEIRELEDRPALTPSERAARRRQTTPATPAEQTPQEQNGQQAEAMAEPDVTFSRRLENATIGEPIRVSYADDPKKPYGDVPYADPGYQSDGKKRYPLDTEEHCRAAWSYINQKSNAAKYTPDQLSKIKGRIRAALKRYGADVENSADEVVRLQFDSEETTETFRVDVERRTIIGLAVPWGSVARSGFSDWRFEPDSLRWSDPSRIKLNLNHKRDELIGRATRLQSGSRGLQATFKIADTSEGDRALALAKDLVLDGLSIEVNFDEKKGDRWRPDPSDESVNLVSQGSLCGVALTGQPAFDDARLTSVVASKHHDERYEEMPEHDKGAGESFDFEAHLARLTDATVESHKKLTGELATSLGDSISAGVKAALEGLPAPQDGPEPVRASRYTVTREAPVYAFNGLGHSLVRDAWYAGREQDSDAIERLRKYRKQTEEMSKIAAQFQASAQFAPQSTTTAADVIPPGYRPDLYVPELMQGRPLVGQVSRGTISNATPFTVPKFTSSTGVSADHVEGTNPADGSLDFSTETVTPGAISGRLTLTREIVDSSNPAIDQIALATMRESYNRQTEQKVYTALNGAATTTVTYAAASVITDVRDLLAQYPFVRFASPTGAAMNQKVTRAFATAEDTSGRPLLPSVGAQNTAGLGNAVSQGWFIDGLTFVPAWSITDALSDDVVLILNRADVWVWESPLLSFRFEEKQGPANIELNIFGYFGTHVLRDLGVFAVRNPAV